MIRILIERRCHPGKEAETEKLLSEMRIKAVHQHGYISGETLRSIEDPLTWLIVSTWVNTDMWKAWETSPERREIISKLEPLLITPEKVSMISFSQRGGAESAHIIDK